MGRVKDILKEIAHRPWVLPEDIWAYYQEWNQALFLHWQVPAEEMKTLLPSQLPLDTYEGKAWVSVVAFTMQKIRPKGLPHFAAISDFHEINLRTYVIRDGKPGVYFINMEGAKRISVFIARSVSGLPYMTSKIERTVNDNHHSYISANTANDILLDTTYTVGEAVKQTTPLDKWLTERYCLYFEKGKKTYRYDIHHKPWPLKEVTLTKLNARYKIKGIIDKQPDLARYSEGVQVVAWKKVLLKAE